MSRIDQWGKSLSILSLVSLAFQPFAYSQGGPNGGFGGAPQQQAPGVPDTTSPMGYSFEDFQKVNNEIFKSHEQNEACRNYSGATGKTKLAIETAQSLQKSMVRGGGKLKKLATGVGAQTLARTGSCPADTVEPVIKSQCSSYSINVGGEQVFQPSKLNADATQLENALAVAECKELSAEKSKSAIECFKGKYEGMKEAMAQLKTALDAKIKTFEDYTSTVTQLKDAEEAKKVALNEEAETLSKTTAEARELVNKLKGADGLPYLRRAIDDQKTRIIGFDKLKKDTKKVRTASCIVGEDAGGGLTNNESLSGCKGNNGEDLRPIQCIGRIFGDAVVLSRNGGAGANGKRIVASRTDEAAAGDARRDFEASVRVMLQDMGSSNFDSPDDWFAHYSPRIQRDALTRVGDARAAAGVVNAIRNQLNGCKALADRAELKDLTENDKSDLFLEKEGIKQTAETISENARVMLGEVGGVTRKVITLMNAAPGAGFDPNSCNAAAVSSNTTGDIAALEFQRRSLSTQHDCIDKLHRSLEAVLDGTVPPNAQLPVAYKIKSKGLTPGDCGLAGDPNVNSCVCTAGFDACVSSMKNVGREIEARKIAMEGEGTFTHPGCPTCAPQPGLKLHTKNANRFIVQAMRDSAKIFSGLVAANKKELEALRKMMIGSGITPLKPVKSKKRDFTCTPNPESAAGLCQMPDDLGETLAEIAGVGVLDDDEFDSKITEAEEKKASFASKKESLVQKYSDLDDLMTTCTQDKNKKSELAKLDSRKSKFKKAKALCSGNLDEEEAPSVLKKFDQDISDLYLGVIDLCPTFKESDSRKACNEFQDEVELEKTTRQCARAFKSQQKEDMLMRKLAGEGGTQKSGD